jgi:rubrerythrin
MVIRKSAKDGGKSGAPRKAAPKGTSSGKTGRTPATASGRKAQGKAGAGKAAARQAPSVRARPAAKVAADVQQERLNLLLQEKVELQSIVRRLRAERDSALAEGTKLQERIRELESGTRERADHNQQPAGPGAFDPSVDLDEEESDGASLEEDELEGAAGFFDRMDEIRARRIELDRERNDRELEQSEQNFWMICPKCGDLMEEQENENIKVERCETCGGLYLDRGEVDLLLSLSGDRDGVRRLHNVLKF